MTDTAALKKHYEDVLDRLLHPVEVTLVLTDTQCADLAREANPMIWTVRTRTQCLHGMLEEDHFTYKPYVREQDAYYAVSSDSD